MATQPETTRSINPFIGLLGLGLIVAVIWIWNHLTFDTQDYITDEILPILGGILVLGIGIWVSTKKWRARKERLQLRDRLLQRFQKEPSAQKRRDLAFTLIEVNQFEAEGLETVTEPMAELFIWTLKTALGDKQHRIRGMSASYLGVLKHQASIPLLIRALEDDHAHVRACAALALGRMRAQDAKAILEEKMKEDWDQTVRSRSREALERIR
ncbi:HEAT repeat domain-containing protein [Candidatus Nitrospira allomarina]|jgi:ABC-type nickel/cobalt efflux system permease component RcnA|uniref:HEAT repeat domain-containing protein n=1 Tax=Candidatus Nitrospira allomarina TaxID=3020900 RepID=A0AA96JTA2_9BACT|nr:HEAT repeat domain-containing protein [Candidatus Nitrospira allomarina]WNM59173.1 HEAT repeat domain-containing protein [Candidatus Nitrospira allomarina]